MILIPKPRQGNRKKPPSNDKWHTTDKQPKGNVKNSD